MTPKTIILIGSILGAFTVMIGAFGAHGLESILRANDRVDNFETAVKYQMFHVLMLFAIGLLMDRFPASMWPYAAWCMLIGIVLFSGSLYILSITNVAKWGMVTPLGGVAFIAGWICCALAIYRTV